jgi:hypothetical protein
MPNEFRVQTARFPRLGGRANYSKRLPKTCRLLASVNKQYFKPDEPQFKALLGLIDAQFDECYIYVGGGITTP